MQMTIADNLDSLQRALMAAAAAGKRVAFVPTMGALHAGHMALIEEAKKRAGFVVASIFVNPTQFAAGEDFDKYPRTLQDDIKKLDAAGASLLYTPTQADMYPAGFSTTVSPGAMGGILCGRFRPGHFNGVATVVAKLLLRVLPHVALFGEKDYQQLCIIRQTVRDLDIPIEIVGVPTVREADGLAMSSRNAYLSAQERKTAPMLYRTLSETAEKIAGGGKVAAVLEDGRAALAQVGFRVDYLELCDADSLAARDTLIHPCRLLAAVWLGKTRLIDNVPVGWKS